MSEQMSAEQAKWKAQGFVYGIHFHEKTKRWEPRYGGYFADRFLGHPWVRESISEGWGAELRGTLVRAVTQRMLLRQTYDVINDLMPEATLIKHWKEQAARYRSAAEWREQIVEQYGSLEHYLQRGQKRAIGRSIGSVAVNVVGPPAALDVPIPVDARPIDRKSAAAGGDQ